ncbi:TFIIH basal transcription factor complex, subunit SSL1 [Piedraia hortae CBS 480.64]|uniref:General transcription and DNA repair factor IIH n=1 Tax=Piedraia hortae CBS 480.64 TaxID=1314780 RepID=A0A6A7C140_9PEZI|nr:TFIIH basal transcription factor complex, subunit SSL1 [Piedraia hortae CBS 480.64]
MAESDPEYDPNDSDHAPKPSARSKHAKWEAPATSRWTLPPVPTPTSDVPPPPKHQRQLKDTTPLQRGIIRNVLLILDLSSSMSQKDLRPTRQLFTIKTCITLVREFFSQNPISQLGILATRDGICTEISPLSGNPSEHITALAGLRSLEPRGNPSLQNTLEMSRALLYHTPPHSSKEVIILLGGLMTSDPGDINTTIASCVKDHVRIRIIGLSAEMFICGEICRRTNGGAGGYYNIATDEVEFERLVAEVAIPSVVVMREKRGRGAELLRMGFPSRGVGRDNSLASLCACHGKLGRGGYMCSMCGARVCALPTTCPVCGLMLILSTHLARSYHHLFPLRNWVEVPWEKGECFGCLRPFEDGEGQGRYECTACHQHFCINCDVFCHEVVHNCPGCLSK